MSNIEKIRQEIERLKAEYNAQISSHLMSESLVSMGKVEALNKVLAFIDSLPDEHSYDTQNYTPTPSVSIDDVARVQFASHAKIIEKKRKTILDWEQFKEVAGIFYGFGKRDSLPDEEPSKELEEEIQKAIDKYPLNKADMDEDDIATYHQGLIFGARHFAEWGRKQVLQEIYDGKIHPVDSITAAWL